MCAAFPRPASPPPPASGRLLRGRAALLLGALLLGVAPLLAPLAHAASPPPAPADCPTQPEESAPPGITGPVTLLPVLPGAGFAAIPLSPEALAPQTCRPASPPLPEDVLHGAPDGNLLDDRGDEVLDGPPGSDPLHGP